MADMFPHVVTIYNVYTETDLSTFEEVTVNHITVLHGVLFDASKGRNVAQSGLESADSVKIYIPFSGKAVDGVTGTKREYTDSLTFWRMDDKSSYWTLSVKNENCFVVKGEAVHPDWSVQKIESMYSDVYDISKVDKKDFGGEMAHFEVGCT